MVSVRVRCQPVMVDEGYVMLGGEHGQQGAGCRFVHRLVGP